MSLLNDLRNLLARHLAHVQSGTNQGVVRLIEDHLNRLDAVVSNDFSAGEAKVHEILGELYATTNAPTPAAGADTPAPAPAEPVDAPAIPAPAPAVSEPAPAQEPTAEPAPVVESEPVAEAAPATEPTEPTNGAA